MALPEAARSAAITNLRADLSSASAICSMAQATKGAEQSEAVRLAGDVVNFNNQWFDTLTARIGYSFQPAWLLYLQGGGAWAHTSTNITFGGVQIGQTSHTGTGWTIGGGAEWMFAPHWSVFLEGNYMDFGSRSGTAFTPVPTCLCGRMCLQRQSNRDDCAGWCELSLLLSEKRQVWLASLANAFEAPGE